MLPRLLLLIFPLATLEMRPALAAPPDPTPTLADSGQDDADEPVGDPDKPSKPPLASPREGTSFSASLPVGVGGGSDGVGVAFGFAGTLGGDALSGSIYVVIANGGSGIYEVGLRYSAPQVFFVEVLVGWVKPTPYYGASFGIGGGVGADIPVYRHFTVTLGGNLSYTFAQRGFFGVAYAAPTLHF